MMEIKCFGSSSEGNCYTVNDGETTIMLECGIPLREILYNVIHHGGWPEACLISHSHKDHLGCAADLMFRGISCYMSQHTAESSGIYKDLILSRAVIIEDGKEFEVGSFIVRPLKMNHDVPCLGFLIYSKATKESLFFATDTYYIQYIIPAVDYIMIETNYDLNIVNRRLMEGDTDMVAKERLIKSHMSIDTAIKWLTTTNLAKCRRIYLLHLSSGNSDEKDFKRRVMEATGCPVTVC